MNKLRKQQLNGPRQHAFVTATFTATATYGGEEDMYRETLRSLHMSPDPIVIWAACAAATSSCASGRCPA